MLLAIDVGNSQTVVGLYAHDAWAATWRIASDITRTADELQVKMNEFFELRESNLSDVDTIIIASVVPHLTMAWEQLARSIAGTQVFVVGPGIKTGITLGISHPHEAGADRIANAVGAEFLYGAPVIVADFGTATNLDVVTKDRAYKGGVISPGVETSAEALFARAARLSSVDLEAPAHALGTSSVTAIQSGLIFGEAAKVDGLIERIFEELGYTATVVATGGLVSLVAPYCKRIDVINENLTLEGLRVIAQRNSERSSKHI